MKAVFTILALMMGFLAGAQIPSGYYNNANGLTGVSLQNALKSIIASHSVRSYANLWTDFGKTDKRPNDSTKVWDIYSDIPSQNPPYTFTFYIDQCGNYNSENDCYNREHGFPKSHFNNAYPMYTDLFHLYPTDGYVNSKRSNYPYAEVGANPSYVSLNGSKVGNSVTPGYSGLAFEPIDSYKGDVARSYFYMVTCYKGNSDFQNWAMANGTTLNNWASAMLLEWHHLDPVSQKEIDRNNAIYKIQGNRNPFIDNPQWADCIWGASVCGPTTITTVNLSDKIRIYPNPASDKVSIDLLSDLKVLKISLIAVDGRLFMDKNNLDNTDNLQLQLNAVAQGLYYLKIVTDKGLAVKKLVVE